MEIQDDAIFIFSIFLSLLNLRVCIEADLQFKNP